MSQDPIRFVFGVHVHQPVGNFDHVIREHVEQVYLPFLEHLADRDFLPICLHISGPLLEWLERHDARYLERVADLAAGGRVELLTSGFYEPVLPALSRRDRIEQLQWMREALMRRFGVEPRGLWLTERVWEPDLAAELAEAGVRYVLVDDRHFLVTGFPRERLHRPFWTESDGRSVALFPIDEKLRYLVPFKPPRETLAYLAELRAEGQPLAVLADDGEKFGGWPGTREWLYEQGWLVEFLDRMAEATADGTVRLTTLGEALRDVPSGGLAYLPTASYREMEGWSLPPGPAARYSRLAADLQESGRAIDLSLVRGSHWRNFLVRYPESNRMHKKMMALSSLCRERGDPAGARRAIGRAQCNDAYWHGVFGGLYMMHLREAIWHNLAVAERELRRGEPLGAESLDLWGEGTEVIWVHSDAFSAVVAPSRGGCVEEYTVFADLTNYANTLTRRKEAYHKVQEHGQAEAGDPAPEGSSSESANSASETDGTPTIHELEGTIRLERLPPLDPDDRALFVDRVLSADTTMEAYSQGTFEPLRSWAGTRMVVAHLATERTAEVVLRDPDGQLEKRIRFDSDGSLRVSLRWDSRGFPETAHFTSEISLAAHLGVRFDPEPVEIWSHPVETVSKSEDGVQETPQGVSVTPLWPVTRGYARIAIPAPSADGMVF